jgi:hypothetical protein
MTKKSGNITGQAFDPSVKTQIETRQRKLGKLNRSIDEIVGYNSSTSFLRLASSINLDKKALTENGNSIEKLPFLTGVTDVHQYLGAGLAKKCVLFGGVVSVEESPSYRFGNINSPGNQIGNTLIPTMPSGIASPDLATGKVPTFNNGAYGWGGLESGYRPIPAIESAEVSFYNRGALAKATIKLKANSIEQLQILDVLYFRVGYTMLLEWGHTAYFDNNGTLTFFKDFATEPFRSFFNNNESIVVDQNEMIASIQRERAKHSYNYDAMIGKVTNFSWSYNNSGYDIEIKLVGLGDIVESLKINKGSGGINELKDIVKTSKDKFVTAETAASTSATTLSTLVTEASKFLNLGADTGYINYLTGKNLPEFKYDTPTQNAEYLNILQAAVNSFNNDTILQSIASGEGYQSWSQQSTALANGSGTYVDTLRKFVGNEPFDPFASTSPDASYDNFLNGQSKIKSLLNYGSNIEVYGLALNLYITKLKSAIASASSATSRLAAATKGVEQARIISANTILQNYNRCSITRWMYDSVYKISNISDVETALAAYSVGITKPFIRIPFKQNSDGAGTFAFDQNYIKIGVLFNYIKSELLVYDKTKTNSPYTITRGSTGTVLGVPFINMDIDSSNTYCLSFPGQMSADPNICVIPFRYFESPDDLKDIKAAAQAGKYPTLNLLANTLTKQECFAPNGYLVENNPYLGHPLDIYLNINFITQCLVENSDRDGRTSLIAFLQAILTGVNEAIGGVNKMQINYDAETNNLRIIEENPLQYRTVKKGDEISTFNVYGLTQNPNPIYNTQGTTTNFIDGDLLWGSFINNVNFTVNIPPNMAAMATISAQASGNIVGENATAIAKLNKGLTDRVITQKLDPNMLEGSATAGSETDPNTIFGQNLSTQKTLKNSIYSDKYLLDEDLTSGLTDINKDIAAFVVGYEALADRMPAPFFLPFNLSLDMHGLSGMRNYERFAITENLLPPTYSVREIKSSSGSILKQGIIDFLIKGISHSVTTNKWVTKLESITVRSERSEEQQALTPGQATTEVNIDKAPTPSPPAPTPKGNRGKTK